MYISYPGLKQFTKEKVYIRIQVKLREFQDISCCSGKIHLITTKLWEEMTALENSVSTNDL
jgi:hypothetical protein